jgi:mannosylfructose-phosphate synthase
MNRIFEKLFKHILAHWKPKIVIAISGPSGCGKSTLAEEIKKRLVENEKAPLVIHCDDYARIPPRDNENLRKSLVRAKKHKVLVKYLGEESEILFSRLNSIIEDFKKHTEVIPLRFMQNKLNKLLHENYEIPFKNIDTLIIEGTWGMKLQADLKIHFDTDFLQTLESRIMRSRDPIEKEGEVVLQIEQTKLNIYKYMSDFLVQPEKGAIVENPRINNLPLHTRFIENNRPHILMITNHGMHEWNVIAGLPDTGGQNVFVNQLTDTLVNMGFKVTIANRGGYQHPVENHLRKGLDYKNDSARILFLEDGTNEFIRKEDMKSQLPLLCNHLNSYVKRENSNFDFIISHYWDAAELGCLFNKSLAKRLKHLWIPHSLGTIKKDNMHPDTWAELRVDERIDNEKKLIPEIDFIGSTSSLLEKHLKEHYQINSPLFLPPCINTKRFKPEKIADDHTVWQVLSESCGLDRNEIQKCRIITEISRTDNTKRKDVLIKAFANLLKHHPDALLAVTIDDKNPELYKKLMELIDELEIKDRVAVLGSIWDLVPALYNISYLYCTPSVMEGFGMSIQEAAACSIPSVSSNLVPFATEFLGNNPLNKGALIVEADDIEGFTKAFIHLFQSEDIRNEMAQSAYEITIPHFTWESMTKTFLEKAQIEIPPYS